MHNDPLHFHFLPFSEDAKRSDLSLTVGPSLIRQPKQATACFPPMSSLQVWAPIVCMCLKCVMHFLCVNQTFQVQQDPLPKTHKQPQKHFEMQTHTLHTSPSAAYLLFTIVPGVKASFLRWMKRRREHGGSHWALV